MNSNHDSTPVVLLHAFPLDSSMWASQRAALAGRFTLVTPDLPGFGEQPALDEEMLSMERAAVFVEELLEAAGIQQCILGGLSMGGYVALECWRKFPQRITAMILADTRAEPDSEEARRGRYEAMERIGGGHYDEFCELLLPRLLSENTRANHPGIVEDTRDIMKRVLPQNASAAILGMAGRRDSVEILQGINVPCLVVVGEHDDLTPPEAARVMAEAIPGATLETIPDAGHLSNMENPVAFNAAVSRFLEKAGASVDARLRS